MPIKTIGFRGPNHCDLHFKCERASERARIHTHKRTFISLILVLWILLYRCVRIICLTTIIGSISFYNLWLNRLVQQIKISYFMFKCHFIVGLTCYHMFYRRFRNAFSVSNKFVYTSCCHRILDGALLPVCSCSINIL